MIRLLLTFAIAALFSSTTLYGQCETEFDLEQKRFFDELIETVADRGNRSMFIDVPVAFHIETVNGNPVYNANNLVQVINQCNDWYADGNFGISQCGAAFYYAQGTSSPPINHVINVYITTSYNGCGVYYGHIQINPTCSLPMDEIVAHEIGHALGLPHTHGYTNYGTTDELVNGSNCTTHGDRFCDTPADPNILGLVNGACVYVGNLTDANGEQYTPNTGNIMSYTNGNCRSHFSPEQLQRMYDVALASEYNCCLTPVPPVQNLSTCLNTSLEITVSSPAPLIRWFDQPEDGNLLFEGTTFSTPLLSQSYSWYVEAVDGCASDRARIAVEVLPGSGVLSHLPKRLSHFVSNGEGQPGGGGQGGGLGGWVSNLIQTDTLDYLIVSSNQLWKFDGDTALAVTTLDINGGTSVSSIIDADGYLLLGINDWNANQQLWRSDGTAEGTLPLYSWDAAFYDHSNFWLTQLDYRTVFGMARADGDAEIWISDGTAEGTQLLMHLPETSGYQDFNFFRFNNKIYFSAHASPSNAELWVTDGTPAGTGLYWELNPNASASPDYLAVFNSELYFSANDGVNGIEMWKTNGIDAPVIVADINPLGGSNPSGAFVTNAGILFVASDGINGAELWFSDGTPLGTTMVQNISSSGSSYPTGFCECNGDVFFGAKIISNEHPSLFKFNLLSQQSSLVKHFSIPGYSGLDEFKCIGNKVYFSAANTGNNVEVWVSDGSNDGTQMITEINLNPVNGSYPDRFFIRDNRVVFTANDGLSNTQLWTFDEPQLLFCQGEDVSINTGNTNGLVHWYADAAGQNYLNTGFDYQINNIQTGTSLWAAFETGGCTSALKEFDIEVLAIESLNFQSDLCFGEETSIEVVVQENIPGTDYALNQGGYQPSGVFESIGEGQFLIEARIPGVCSVDSLITITEVEELVVQSFEIQHPLCYGDFNGTIAMNVTGGGGSLSYSIDGSEPGLNPFFTNLEAGVHTVSISDSLGCFYEPIDFELSAPDELSAVVEIQQSYCGNECGGSVSVTVSGGIAATEYQYLWFDGNGDTLELENSWSINDLCSDSYRLEVMDDNNCMLSMDNLNIDEIVYTQYYPDLDLDGYGDESEGLALCLEIEGWIAIGGDCDDTNPNSYPGAPGNADGVDANCNGILDLDESLCAGDLNADGVINANDLLTFLSNYGCSGICAADLDEDGDTDTNDLLLLLTYFGTSCP
jgi:ELWxxDGT repeat protein